jgi:hypothetical protein
VARRPARGAEVRRGHGGARGPACPGTSMAQRHRAVTAPAGGGRPGVHAPAPPVPRCRCAARRHLAMAVPVPPGGHPVSCPACPAPALAACRGRAARQPGPRAPDRRSFPPAHAAPDRREPAPAALRPRIPSGGCPVPGTAWTRDGPCDGPAKVLRWSCDGPAHHLARSPRYRGAGSPPRRLRACCHPPAGRARAGSAAGPPGVRAGSAPGPWHLAGWAASCPLPPPGSSS